ncbi:MAG: hypothetical protein DME34_10615, partial [Verrucomicrobia bacterium]
MFTRAAGTAISVLLAAHALAQTPPLNKPPSPSPTPSAQPSIDSLGQADVQAAINLLKTNFVNSETMTETELDRAALAGLLVRMPGALMLVPAHTTASAEAPAPFYSEVFEGGIGYFRLGALSSANLQQLDKKFGESKNLGALIVDLRDSATGDFVVAAEFAKRFCPR